MKAERVLASAIGDVDRHVRAAEVLSAPDQALARRGASISAGVAALQLAATAARTDATFAGKVDALRRYVEAVGPGRRGFAAALIDAALSAEVDLRMRQGLPPHDRRLFGWVAQSGQRPDVAPHPGGAGAAALESDVVRAYAEGATDDDVDLVLLTFQRLVEAMLAAVRHGKSRGPLLDEFQAQAFALCVWPPVGPHDDARRTLLQAFLLLRRPRPLAAAIVRARLRWPHRTRLEGLRP